MTADEQDAGTGISSDRVGPSGPGQEATTGVRDTSKLEPVEPDPEVGSEAGSEAGSEVEEVHPDPPIPPVAGYSSHDPRSEDKPYQP